MRLLITFVAMVVLVAMGYGGALIGRAYEQSINRPQVRAIHTVCQSETPCVFHEYRDLPRGDEEVRTHRSWVAARWAIDDDDTLRFWKHSDDDYWDSIVVDLRELAEQRGHLLIEPYVAGVAMNEELHL